LCLKCFPILRQRCIFHKAAIRPGKPILFAELAGGLGDRSGASPSCAFFGMPGNPISTVIALRFFVEPYLRSFLGLASEKPKLAKLLGPVTKPMGLRSFLKGHVTREKNGELRVQVLKEQASYMVAALGESNSWVVIDEDRDSLSADESVAVVPLANGFGDWI
jgi:molybdopterin molybdotransferase